MIVDAPASNAPISYPEADGRILPAKSVVKIVHEKPLSIAGLVD